MNSYASRIFGALAAVGLLCAAAGADTITPPAAVSLECVRRGTKESGSLSLSYIAEAAGKTITVSAAAGTGTAVANAKLYIKGGDLTTYTLLITESTSETARTLENSTPIASGSIADIYLKLDATGVEAGAENLDESWTYTLTYTLSQ